MNILILLLYKRDLSSNNYFGSIPSSYTKLTKLKSL